MRLDAISLRIDSPVGAPLPGRGFYQADEERLLVQVGQFSKARHFFSYLESDHVRFDIDRDGRLMLIEVDLPRRQWPVADHLPLPTIADRADVHWLDFRAGISNPELLADQSRSHLLLRFAESQSWRWYQIAEAVLIQVDAADHLTAMMVTRIEDDLAGRRIAAFRKTLRGSTAKQGSRGPSPKSGRPAL